MKKVVLMIIMLLIVTGSNSYAMTIQQLQDFSNTLVTQANDLNNKANALKAYANQIQFLVSSNNQFFNVFFPNQAAVDSFVTAQTPIYIQKLTDIEISADTLGTDQYH